jgi:hypothetical protein
MSRTLSAPIGEGLIELDEVITDGTKLRAWASRDSMHRAARVEEIGAELKTRIARLREELDADPAGEHGARAIRRAGGGAAQAG